jgi:hypothetical protein
LVREIALRQSERDDHKDGDAADQTTVDSAPLEIAA